MSVARTWPRLPLFAALALLTGCVERRFVIETNVPGAEVYVNNVRAGPSPADAHWDYAGRYEFRVVAQGFEPFRQVEHVRARWYDYPPLDFIFETLWPFHIEDVRRFHFDLVPATQIRTDELLNAADSLRTQGQNLPPPRNPEPEKKSPPPSAPPATAPPIVAAPTNWNGK